MDQYEYRESYSQAAATEPAPPPFTRGGEEGASVVLDPAFCPVHCPQSNQDSSVGWAEKENGTLLPNVNLSLSVLGPNMKRLLKEHGGEKHRAWRTYILNVKFNWDNMM